MRIQVRNSSSSFPSAIPRARTSLSYTGFEGFAADAEPGSTSSFMEQGKRGSKRGSASLAWDHRWDERRSRVSVADWPDNEPLAFNRPERERHGFNEPVDFQEEETAADDLDLPPVPDYWTGFAPSPFDLEPAPRGPL